MHVLGDLAIQVRAIGRCLDYDKVFPSTKDKKKSVDVGDLTINMFPP